MRMLIQLIITGLALGGVYSLISMGYSLIYKASGLMTFAQGDILTVGAFLGLTFYRFLKLPYIVVGMPDFSNQLCWIDTNNCVAGQIAVTHLWNCGYDRIAFIGGPQEDTISAHRLSGVLATLNENVPAGYVQCGEPTSAGGRAAVHKLLALPEPPNAIICANQYIAFGCVKALQDAGVKIPEKAAVITFDDFPFSKVLEPQLTVVNLDMYDMGEQAAKIVLRRIRKPQLVVQSQSTLPLLIERQSTMKKLRRV